MYLDTVAIKSSKLKPDVIAKIESLLETTARWKNDTGEVIFQAQSGWIKGSYDSALRIGLTGDGRIKARASIPKLLQGHNVTPTISNTQAGIWILHHEVQKAIGMELNPWNEWELSEVHKAQNYYMTDVFAVKAWLDYHKRALRYTRREVQPYQNGLNTPGRRSTIKVYGKGIEFKRHQASKIADKVVRADLQKLSDCLLRVEVEIRAKQLKDITIAHRLPLETPEEKRFQRLLRAPIKMSNQASEINEFAIENYCHGMIKKLVSEIESGEEMEIVRNDYEVRERLYSMFSKTKASRLYAAWVEFTTVPEQDLKQLKSKATFYRQRNELQKAGVSWIGTNIRRVDALPWPSNFSLMDFKTYAQHNDDKYKILEKEIMERIAV